MTFGSLMNWGSSYSKAPAVSPIERYHSGSGYWEHKSHGHGYKSSGKGGGGSAALSALTLLAFLFLINVMQQSLQDNNSTTPATGTGTTALLLRDGQQPLSLNTREATDDQPTKSRTVRESVSSNGATKSSKKGDTLQRGVVAVTYT